MRSSVIRCFTKSIERKGMKPTADSPILRWLMAPRNHSVSYQQKYRFSTGMQDEYGEMTADGETFVKTNFVLENGTVLPEAQVRYQTYGKLNEARDNVVVVCHALTGNASLHAWWGELLGKNLAFDTDKYFIVCCNILGSCYGSTNPRSINPDTGFMYGKDFPDISVKDTVRLQLQLLHEELRISSVKAVIGGSFGGMQAVEYAVQAGSTESVFQTPDGKSRLREKVIHILGIGSHDASAGHLSGAPFVRSAVPIACGAAHTAWQIAISEVQRQAIYADPFWETDGLLATKGLEVARQIGMISYRTPQGYQGKFGRQLRSPEKGEYGSDALWQVKSYLQYQGLKFIDRFDPITYVKLTEQMDSHDVSRGRNGSISDVLGRVDIPVNVLGIDSDVLYPLSEQEELVGSIPNSELKIIHSDEGHDGFLLEQEQVGRYIKKFLDSQR